MSSHIGPRRPLKDGSSSELKVWESQFIHLIIANGNRLEVMIDHTYHYCRVVISITTPVTITKRLSQPCILGADFLKKNNCSVNLVNMTLNINGKSVSLKVNLTAQTMSNHKSKHHNYLRSA